MRWIAICLWLRSVNALQGALCRDCKWLWQQIEVKYEEAASWKIQPAEASDQEEFNEGKCQNLKAYPTSPSETTTSVSTEEPKMAQRSEVSQTTW